MFLKPRLRLKHRVWGCGLPNYLQTAIYGLGYTPKEAYDDWLSQFNRYRLFGGSFE
jgi:hypothetical protein